MKVSTTTYKNCDLVKVNGKIDHSTFQILADTLDELIESGRYKIVLDMSGVEYMSSAGLRVLANTRTSCRRNSRGDIVLVNVPPLIYEVLELSAFTKLFKIYDDVVEAVASI